MAGPSASGGSRATARSRSRGWPRTRPAARPRRRRRGRRAGSASLNHPFSTELLASFYTSRIALVEYWLNVLVLGALILAAAEYAARARLFNQDNQATIMHAIRRRVYVAQALYLFATLLCVIDTRLSIGLIVLVQLNYANAPRFAFLHRI